MTTWLGVLNTPARPERRRPACPRWPARRRLIRPRWHGRLVPPRPRPPASADSLP